MKFIVDAHLPPGLCTQLQTHGHEALHTSILPAENRTPDKVINQLSMLEERVVITKDTDFYYSHLLSQEPWKLVLVRTGNISARDLKVLFEKNLSAIISALQNNSLIELHRDAIYVVV